MVSRHDRFTTSAKVSDASSETIRLTTSYDIADRYRTMRQ
jgi:hypothetical protein